MQGNIFRLTLPGLMLALGGGAGLPAYADFTQSRATQVQLTVDGASGSANASTTAGFAVSGSGITVTGPLNSGASINPNAQFSAPSNGGAFTFSMSTFTPDNRTPTNLGNGSSVVLPAYSDVSVTVGGSRETLGGTISTTGEGTITPGGPGTRAVLTQTRSFSVFDRTSSPGP
ncbi:MAG: hypothetical protein ACOYMP_14315 [Nodosilinea sp.]